MKSIHWMILLAALICTAYVMTRPNEKSSLSTTKRTVTPLPDLPLPPNPNAVTPPPRPQPPAPAADLQRRAAQEIARLELQIRLKEDDIRSLESSVSMESSWARENANHAASGRPGYMSAGVYATAGFEQVRRLKNEIVDKRGEIRQLRDRIQELRANPAVFDRTVGDIRPATTMSGPQPYTPLGLTFCDPLPVPAPAMPYKSDLLSTTPDYVPQPFSYGNNVPPQPEYPITNSYGRY